MSGSKDPKAELNRLRRALVAVSEDLDALERRPHLSLRLAAENLGGSRSLGMESFVDNFAVAMKRGSLA
jgi:hypothetical protein